MRSTIRFVSALALFALLGNGCGGEQSMNDADMSPVTGGGSGGAGGADLPGPTPGLAGTGSGAGAAGSGPGLPLAGSASSAGSSGAGSGGSSSAGASAAGAGAAGAGGAAGGTGGTGDAGMGRMPSDREDGGSAGSAGAGSSGEYQPCPPKGEVCNILPLGDSITFGIGYAGGYRVELFKKAHAAGKMIAFTGSLSNGPNMVDGVPFPKSNEGHSGWKIAQLRPLIPDPAFDTPPHIILLMIGTNDLTQNDDLPNAPKRLGELLDLLAMNAPDALIVVAKLTPLSFGGGVSAYNDALPAVVDKGKAKGQHLLLVDQFTGFPTSELGDGVHPDQQGYERMAGVWYDAIEELLP